VADGTTGKTLAKDTDYTLSYSTDVTDVGTVTVAVKGTGNYAGTVTRTYKITPATLTVTTAGAQKTYDGKALTATGEISGFVNGETATFATTGTQTAVGNSDNTYSLTWDGTAKKSNYTIRESLGKLTVAPVDAVVVTITGHHDSKTYDGKAHSVTGYDVSISDDLYTAKDFTFSGNDTASRTDVGTTNMNLANTQFANTNTNFTNVKFDVTDGYIEITAADIADETRFTVSQPEDVVYNGVEQKQPVTVADGTTGKTLAKDTDYTLSYSTDVTDVGTVTVAVKGTGNYAGTVTRTYKITPATLTVTTAGAQKTYDGKALTATGEISGFVNGETATFATTGTQTAVGNSDNTYSLTWDGTAKKSNYTIRESLGKLTVAPVDAVVVTITGHHDSKTYDGKAHSVTGYDVSISDDLYTAKDFTFSGNDTASRTDVGTTNMNLANTQFANTNTNFTNVKFDVTDGYIEITAADIADETRFTVSQPEDVVYNGVEQKQPVTVADGTTGKTLAKDTDYTLSYSTDVTDVGTVTVAVKGTGNYAGTVTRTYKITPATLTVTTAGAQKTYDGKALTATGEISGFVNGETATFATTGTQTAVGNSDNTYSLTWDGTAKKSNYTIRESLGKLTVAPVDAVVVTITGHHDSKTYDGKAHSVTGYDVSISDDLYTAKDFTFSGNDTASRTDVGTTNMNLANTQFANTNTNFTNVKFDVTDGYIEITAADIADETRFTVSQPEDVVYNGVEQKQPVTVADGTTGKTLAKDTDYTLSYSTDVTDVGTVTVAVKGTGNYAGTVTRTYKITPATLTVTTAGAQKTYDGKALTATGEISGFVNGETATFATTGTQTAVGNSDNTYSLTWDGTAKKSNYTIRESLGKLTVAPVDAVVVTITGHHDSKTYDGKAHSVTGYDVSISDDLYTAKDFTFSGNDTASRTDVGTTNMNLANTQFANTNTNFTNVKFDVTDGYMTITPADISDETRFTVSQPEDVVYNGLEQKQSVTVEDETTGNTLAKDTDYTLSYSTDVTDVGTVTITVTGIGNYAGTVTRTYKIRSLRHR
jgi:RES domain-containing protein